MPFRYVPLLRTKAGEVTALQNLAAADKQRIFPIFHLVAAPPATFGSGIIAAWTGMPLALDGLFNFGITGNLTAFNVAMNALGHKIPVIPCAECDAPQNYLAGIKRFVGKFAPGLVVKATLRQLPTLGAWVAAQQWRPDSIDLVVTAGHAADYDPPTFEGFVTHAIQAHIAANNGWRSITLASSAAPRDTGALAYGRNVIPRLDWQLWNGVQDQMPFQLDYGDYGIAYPDLTEPPGIAMTRATVSVKYTIDDEWILRKGRSTTGAQGQPMTDQYRAHAKALVREPQFGGLPNCWADDRIKQIAATNPPQGAGNRPQWVGISVNRHLSLVANRLP
jgi:hypothetical protein